MNEIFDKLILRLIFAVYLCLMLLLYKYAHSFLYPTSRQQLFKRFFPSKNISDTLHIMSRIIGVGMIFSEFQFTLSEGFLFALFDFLLFATVALALYLVSLYIIESIVLYNFEYIDEVIKRKNISYALISLAHSVGVAYIIKVVLSVSQHSLIMLFFLWLFAMVIMGFASKTFHIVSKLPFNQLIVQKNPAVSYSYIGFIWGWILIISSSLDHQLLEIRWYAIQVVLKIILSLIIIPIFLKGLVYVFRLQESFDQDLINDSKSTDRERIQGYGVYEGALFLAACFLTTVITGKVEFGIFYPVF